jgi:hypothetical protein
MISFVHRTCLLSAFAALGVGMLSAANPATAHDVTFTRNSPPNPGTSNSYNLIVTLERQGGGTSGQCTMTFNDPDDQCTIANFPTTSNALVTVYHRTSPTGAQDTVIGKFSFWVGVFSNMTVHIPTGDVRYISDQTGAELASIGNIAIAILPQANVEMGETVSDRPNSGASYFGQTMGNCGSSVNLLRSDGSGCPITMLAGCYSPVFARPASGSKAAIWVNRGDGAGADHVLCIENGVEVNYTIKVP